MVISLWGFMGAGKSTVGRSLASRLNWTVLDTDDVIEQEQGKTIAQIFAELGEEEFRQMEKSLIEQLYAQKIKNTILITGGGLPVWPGNAELLNRMGRSVFIDVSFEVICERLQQDDSRPLWNKTELPQMRQRYELRRPMYQKAQIHIQAGRLGAAEITDLILKELSLGERV